ncbi:MAG TPA: phenylalanine--tRNA ligase subunit beta [Candidatus Pacearchaeota archaeon]|nr:phenylalanine--tRNA ligase subunit beta [Candidatus Pacearchaeota archaeon]
MKVIYSQLLQLIPGLKAKPKEIGEAMTFCGFMMDDFKEIEYQGKRDYLLSFEIRQNRADCFSVLGIAREVAAYYGLKMILSGRKVEGRQGLPVLPIKIEAKNNGIKRIIALRMSGVRNQQSPQWLQEFLEVYDINSKNALVDISNYIMIFTGYPSHLLDNKKLNGTLRWSNARKNEKITTLDGSAIELLQKNELVIRDDEKILALAGIIGGQAAAIDLNTTDIVAEMAVYNGAAIRRDSRSTKLTTEASNRLEKDLDTEGAEFAMDLMIGMLKDICGGELVSQIFEYYPIKKVNKSIKFDVTMPTIYAGIEIAPVVGLDILKRLEFEVEETGENNIHSVVCPSYRTDLSYPQDLYEEVIRIYGYNKIPVNKPPLFEVVPDITPKRILASQKIQEILSSCGFDEILSLPLTERGESKKANYLPWEAIETENAINENHPELRQTLLNGLLRQAREYLKKNIEIINLFEIGKVFGKSNGGFHEFESLGLFVCGDGKVLDSFKSSVERVVRMLGRTDIIYRQPEIIPEVSNRHNCWMIEVNGKKCGVIYKLKPEVIASKNAYFAEINVDELLGIKGGGVNPVVELSNKLVPLDINVELGINDNPDEYIQSIKNRIGNDKIWSIQIKDSFGTGDKIKYTIRISYVGLTDPEAKKIHMELVKQS